MNQTPNYQLNQWEKTDRIQMEDFNADNAKIEAALAAVAAGGLTVKTGSFSGDGKTGTKTYNIGAKPKLVFLRTTNSRSSTHYRGMLINDILSMVFDSAGASYMADPGSYGALTNNGFSVVCGNAYDQMNTAGTTLYYWALC